MSDPLRPLLIMKDYCQNPWVSWGPSPGDAHSYMHKVGVFRSLSSITRCRVLSSPIPIFDIGVLGSPLVLKRSAPSYPYLGNANNIVNTEDYSVLPVLEYKDNLL